MHFENRRIRTSTLDTLDTRLENEWNAFGRRPLVWEERTGCLEDPADRMAGQLAALRWQTVCRHTIAFYRFQGIVGVLWKRNVI